MPRNALCMTRILRLLPCWGCLFTWVPHSTLLRFFFSVCDHSCLCSYAPYGMPDWCSVCSSSQLNSSNLTTASATTFCPYSPAAADVCALCTILFVHMCVFMFVRCIYIWKSFDVIIHAESQENWPSSVGLVALPQGWIVHIYTHTHMYTKTGISGWVLPNQWDISSVPFIMCYQLTSVHNMTNTSAHLILSPNFQ